MAEDTLQEVTAPGALLRGQADATERVQPIPLMAGTAIFAVLLCGVGYLLMAGPPGATALVGRHTLADPPPAYGPVGARAGVAGSTAHGPQLHFALCVAQQSSSQELAPTFPPLDTPERVPVPGDGEIPSASVACLHAMPGFTRLGDAELNTLGPRPP